METLDQLAARTGWKYATITIGRSGRKVHLAHDFGYGGAFVPCCNQDTSGKYVRVLAGDTDRVTCEWCNGAAHARQS